MTPTQEMIAETTMLEEVMTSGELFAGVGGLERAIEPAFGSVATVFAEFDDAPSRVLAHRYPGVPNLGDVSKIDWTPYRGKLRILGGGFPCTDVSLAGRRKGLQKGTRSGLWAEYRRAIEEVQPDWVVIENVRGLLSADGEPPHDEYIAAEQEVLRLNRLLAMAERFRDDNPTRSKTGRSAHVTRWRGVTVRLTRSRKRAIRRLEHERGSIRRAIDTVLRDLAELGFDAEWTGVRASDVGAPHARFRIFILAWPSAYTGSGGGGGRSEGQESSRGDDAAHGSDPGGDRGRQDTAGLILPTPTASIQTKSARAMTASTENGRRSGGGQSSPLGLEETVSLISGVRPDHLPADADLPPASRAIVDALLPTPAAGNPNDGESAESFLARKAKWQHRFNNTPPLAIAVQSVGPDAGRLLPTPEAKNGSSGPDYARAGRPRSGADDLITALTMQMLPTPVASDSESSARHTTSTDASHSGTSLTDAARSLLPTPRASEGEKGGPNQRGSSGDLTMSSAVQTLLPSPTAALADGGQTSRSGDRSDEPLLGGIAADAARLSAWGPYAAAIARWERVIGRPAPSPVRYDGRDGKPRLNPELTEWMMGWPEGWLTDPAIGLTRAEQLKACGNGVVTLQALAALLELLSRPGVPPVRYRMAA